MINIFNFIACNKYFFKFILRPIDIFNACDIFFSKLYFLGDFLGENNESL